MGGPLRLQKYLSQAGIASRRAAEQLILAGRVRLNGQLVTELGVKLDPDRDTVEVDGRPVRPERRLWVALHKPRGVVSTRRDTHGRETVYDRLPHRYRRLFHVGRLDRESEGLMLLTNDGDTAHRLMHPRFRVERVYEVEVEGRPPDAQLARLVKGVELDDGTARAVSVERMRETAQTSTLRLTLCEGRKREVRRMLDAIGFPVRRLIRLRYGPVELGGLGPGSWRVLGRDEVERIDAAVRDSEPEAVRGQSAKPKEQR
ncbi:MAG: pseudouridine synthase [Longimicrobiales bacterium]